MAHRFSPQLLLERIRSTSGHYGSPAQDERTTAWGFNSLTQPKTGAAVNPVPPLRFLPLLAQLLRLPPLLIVSFPNVPRVQFDHQREGLQRLLEPQFLNLLLCSGPLVHLLVQLLARIFGPFALAARLSIQGRSRQLHPSQTLDHRAGLADRQLAYRQSRHLLHTRRTTACFT